MNFKKATTEHLTKHGPCATVWAAHPQCYPGVKKEGNLLVVQLKTYLGEQACPIETFSVKRSEIPF